MGYYLPSLPRLRKGQAVRRRLLATMGIITAVGVCAFVAAWLAWPDGRLSAASCARIHAGMTLDQVEELLGGPEGVYASDGNDWSMGFRHNGLRGWGHTVRVWLGDDGYIRVEFDRQQRVVQATWTPRGGRWWHHIRARLGL